MISNKYLVFFILIFFSIANSSTNIRYKWNREDVHFLKYFYYQDNYKPKWQNNYKSAEITGINLDSTKIINISIRNGQFVNFTRRFINGMADTLFTTFIFKENLITDIYSEGEYSNNLTDDKITYIYDSCDNLKSRISYIKTNSNNDWNESYTRKFENQYNLNKQLKYQEIHTRSWPTSDWDFIKKIKYTYDNTNKLEQLEHNSWYSQKSLWIDDYKNEMTYNSDGKLSEMKIERAIPNIGINSYEPYQNWKIFYNEEENVSFETCLETTFGIDYIKMQYTYSHSIEYDTSGNLIKINYLIGDSLIDEYSYNFTWSDVKNTDINNNIFKQIGKKEITLKRYNNKLKFNLASNVYHQDVKAIIFDSRGRTLYKKIVDNPKNNSINIDNLSNGTYFFNVQINNRLFTKQFSILK